MAHHRSPGGVERERRDQQVRHPQTFPTIDLETQKVGVFGRLVKLDAALRPGDRVEIYRPITCDPQTVPRRDSTSDDDE
jgi:putative ubiquitin-RnfH superfamily antitoxin RatB of RatAB toxin-antitoxin module